MRQALPPEVEISKADWLEAREAAMATQVAAQQPSASREAAPASLALIPREVPVLPKGYVPRKAILDGIKRNLFSLGGAGSAAEGGGSSAAAAGAREGATLLVQGMGGSGKTVVASSIARDSEVGAKFDLVCFVGVGQDADLRELQRSLHFQLQRTTLDPSLREEEEVFAALQAAAADRTVLLVIIA